MSKKTTTTTTNQFNDGGMQNYNQFQGTLGSQLQNFARNPLASSFFNQQLSMAQNNASAIGQRNMSNVLSNMRTGGGLLGNSGSFMQSMVNRTMLGNSINQSNAFNSTLNNALASQRWALGSMQAFTPLQTGQTSVQKTNPGLGSILGTVAGIGLNMALPGLGSMMGGGAFSDGYSPSTWGGKS